MCLLIRSLDKSSIYSASPIWLNDSAIVYFEVTFDKVPTFANFKKKPYVIAWVEDKWQKSVLGIMQLPPFILELII